MAIKATTRGKGMKAIIKENGNIKAKVDIDEYGAELLTMRNGYQWVGQSLSPELARLTIEALQEYLKESEQ